MNTERNTAMKIIFFKGIFEDKKAVSGNTAADDFFYLLTVMLSVLKPYLVTLPSLVILIFTVLPGILTVTPARDVPEYLPN